MIGAIKLEHPAAKFQGNPTGGDLKTGTIEKGWFYSSKKTLFNERWIDGQYRMFSGLYFTYYYIDRETKWDGSKLENFLEADADEKLKEIVQIDIIKDGIILVDMRIWMQNLSNGGDFSYDFEDGAYFTDFAQYLSVKKPEKYITIGDSIYENPIRFWQYYFKDIKSIEEKFEFRLGNFGTKNSDGTKNISLSPFAYSYNDLIKSPQGKLVKAGN